MPVEVPYGDASTPGQPLDAFAPGWDYTVSTLEASAREARGTKYEHIWDRAADLSEELLRRMDRLSA
jgi:hypothetical protein